MCRHAASSVVGSFLARPVCRGRRRDAVCAPPPPPSVRACFAGRWPASSFVVVSVVSRGAKRSPAGPTSGPASRQTLTEGERERERGRTNQNRFIHGLSEPFIFMYSTSPSCCKYIKNEADVVCEDSAGVARGSRCPRGAPQTRVDPPPVWRGGGSRCPRGAPQTRVDPPPRCGGGGGPAVPGGRHRPVSTPSLTFPCRHER